MNKKYESPMITVEKLETADVLLRSEQTDNKHIQSNRLIKSNFKLEDILT